MSRSQPKQIQFPFGRTSDQTIEHISDANRSRDTPTGRPRGTAPRPSWLRSTNARQRLREITNQVIEPGPESLQEKLEELRTFAVLRLTHLRELLTNPAAIHEARALLADQIGKFKLERVNENGRISFKANGNIDFFGEGGSYTRGWCRGPESNWLRPPFQGGALPMSYPGSGDLEIVGVMRSCVNSVKNTPQINVRNRRIPSSSCGFSGPRAVWCRRAGRRCRPFP